MAYQVKRQKKEYEELELVNQRGEVVEVLRVELNDADMIRNASKKHVELLQAQRYCQSLREKGNVTEDMMSDAIEKLGNATIDFFEAALGEENAKKVLDFYEGRILEMVQEVTPFLTEVVIPKARKIVQKNKKGIVASYNRKQRRSLMFGRK